LAVAAPHLPRLPPWLAAAVIFCGAWRLYIGRQGATLPHRGLRLILVGAGVAGVFLHYGTLLGRDPGVAMLTLMAGLKLLEMRERRDTLVLLYLAYFLVITQFLYSQSLFTAGYMLAMVLATTVLLITVTRRTGQRVAGEHLRTAAAMVAQALPVMLALFLLLPRLPGPLWPMPEQGTQAVSGLDGNLTPGSVSALARSDAVAFRAYFDDVLPPPEQRYWRGPVLAAYDGRTWTGLLRPNTSTRLVTGGEALDYEIMLEPHGRRWLFALDLAATAPADAGVTPAWEMVADDAVDERRRDRWRSYTDYRLEPRIDTLARTAFTMLPPGIHPLSRRLAGELRAEAETPTAYVERVLAWFRAQPFIYTLSPPALPGDAVDQFLFETRRGFCEHYAAAFAVLMRAADVPARVVTGYLGGEPSVSGDYLIVRQSNAHAWVEVWLAGRGWVRVDPTATVAPARIREGLAGAVPATDPVPLMARLDSDWLRMLHLQWDALSARWNTWVLGYGPELQQRLLGWLRLDGPFRSAAALAAALLLAMALGAAAAWIRNRPHPDDPAVRAWNRAGSGLARIGLRRRPDEGPSDYAARVAAARPDLAAVMAEITELYVQLRYEERTDATRLSRLRKAVTRLLSRCRGERTRC
jgi:transglutaminase-like putative cysteine protease